MTYIRIQKGRIDEVKDARERGKEDEDEDEEEEEEVEGQIEDDLFFVSL